MLNCWCITWPVGFKRLINCGIDRSYTPICNISLKFVRCWMHVWREIRWRQDVIVTCDLGKRRTYLLCVCVQIKTNKIILFVNSGRHSTIFEQTPQNVALNNFRTHQPVQHCHCTSQWLSPCASLGQPVECVSNNDCYISDPQERSSEGGGWDYRHCSRLTAASGILENKKMLGQTYRRQT